MQADNRPQNRPWLAKVMAFFFHHLYHTFAGSYDLVASTVSLGQWRNWVTGVIPFISGSRVLEIGFGPGHLQVALYQSGDLRVFGLDESPQMARLAARRLREQHPMDSAKIVRSRVEHMPFADASFDTVVATFPTPYIVRPETISQVHRVLSPGGRLVVLLAARHMRNTLLARLADGLFAVTGQAPPEPDTFHRLTELFEQSGLQASVRWETSTAGKLLLLIAEKSQIQ